MRRARDRRSRGGERTYAAQDRAPGGLRRVRGIWTFAGGMALLLAAAALSGFTILRGYAPHDEGLMLAWASRVADGQWPYRDFWSNYAPGQTVLLAGLWKLFGPSLLTWRVLRVALDAVVALLAWLLVRRAAPGWLALLVWLAVAAAMAWPTGPGPNPTALALGVGAILAARGRGGSRATGRPGLAGFLAGLAILFRPEIGVAALLGVAVHPRVGVTHAQDHRVDTSGRIAAPTVHSTGAEAGRGRRHAAVAWRTVAIAAAVAVAGFLPFAVVAGGAMADQLVGFLGIQHLQRLPLQWAPHTTDPNKVLERLFPAVLVGCAALLGLWSLLRRRWHPLLPLAAVGLLYLLGRTDAFHLVPLSVAAAIALGAAVATERAVLPRALLLMALVLIAAHGLDRRATALLHPPALAAVPGPAGDGVRTTPRDARALRRLRAAVAARTHPREPIFVANPRHDRVTAGDPLLYVLLGHPNATRYDVMQPGVVTGRAVQREIVRDLRDVRVVVRWLDPRAERREPNGAGREHGARLLDRHLARAFRAVARFGAYQLLTRR